MVAGAVAERLRPRPRWAARWSADPRHAQIAVLSGLVAWGAFALQFGARPACALAIGATAIAVEFLGTRWCGRRFDPRSPCISALSLVLLLRADGWVWGAVAAGIAVGSKFVIRRGGKHLFNPTNLALVVLLLATDRVWVSSGQWGSGALLAAALVAAACWVLPRARGDVTLAFVTFWAGALVGRALWLGDPLAIARHQLADGGLLLFAGFMISDPRTIPDTRPGRIAFAAAVAALAYWLRFARHEPDALLYALAVCALAVPWIDRLVPGRRFEWPAMPRTLVPGP